MRAVLTLAALAALALTGCHAEAPDATAVLRRGNGAEPESLDPHHARSEAALTILRDLYEGLTEVGADGPVLAAADRCEMSADGRTYRFHLRDGARWSNGDAVRAEDFAAAWRRLVDPKTGAQYAQLLAPIEGAEEITGGRAPPSSLNAHALDPSTLEVRLKDPAPYFLSIVAHPATFPLNGGELQRRGSGFAKPKVMVSNGAFTLQRWDFGSHLVAERNPAYWNDAATRIDRVEYYSITEPGAELRAFRSGALDVTSTIPGSQIAWIKQNLGQELHVAPQLGVYYLGLNLRRAPLRDSPALRRALSLVIDRERLVQAVTGTGEAPAYTFVPPGTLGYEPPVPEYAKRSMQQRIEQARQLLAAAGLARAPPALELRYNSGELHGRIAVAVAAMWKEALGIDTTLRAEEFKVLLQDIDRGDGVQVFRASWLADYDDAYSFLQVLHSGFGINLTRYSNARYDALLARAGEEPDVGRRRTLLQDAETEMLSDQPLIPLYFYVAKHLVGAQVGGWRDNAMNVVYSKGLAKDGSALRFLAGRVAICPPTL